LPDVPANDLRRGNGLVEFAISIVRCLQIVIRPSAVNVWPSTADRARHAERRDAIHGEEPHELELLFAVAQGEGGSRPAQT
jgi:hypothetical protein